MDARRLLNLAVLALKNPAAAVRVGLAAVRELSRTGVRGAIRSIADSASRVDSVRAYFEWVAQFDTPKQAEVERQQATASLWADAPLVSILMPVRDPDPEHLYRAIASVERQTYPKWQLCIVDDASCDERVRRVLLRAAQTTERISLLRREARGNISIATNDALQLARGKFILCLDHDDELSPFCLFRLVEQVVSNRQLVLVYGDEDKLDSAGARVEPHFKPDWNPLLLLGQNYLCHAVLVRTDAVRAAGGFRVGFEGAQDHDLWLRITAALSSAQIAHVPRILYHWRMTATSTASSITKKPQASLHARRAVVEHLERAGIAAEVTPIENGHLRVTILPSAPEPSVTIIVPTRDMLHLLRACVEGILALTEYRNYRILVIDNGSTKPETHRYLAEKCSSEKFAVLQDNGPFNFSRLNNRAVAESTSDVVVLMNNDVEVIDAHWLRKLVGLANQPKNGCVGAMLLYPDRTIQHAGVILGVGGIAGHAYSRQPIGYPGYFNRARLVQNVSAVTAACLAVRRSVYLAAGGMDESLAVAFNDVDFCIRVRELGLWNVWTPDVVMIHHESASRGYEDSHEKQTRFGQEIALMQRRWGEKLLEDPAYNLNLSLAAEPFTLNARGPRVRSAALNS